MISSTARDMLEHRKEVLDACLRQDMFPVMMEHLPTSDADAIAASLKLVDDADIYVGVFAHRYGYVPKENNPRQISITEMEYDCAVERAIPRLIFMMDEAHPITIKDVEQGDGAARLEALKGRLRTENIVSFFKSPADLRAHVINSLSRHHQPDLATVHYVSNIPALPEAFIAHPYALLQTPGLIGRRQELGMLTNWVTSREEQIYDARILNVVAIGGLGKSALTWRWFNDIAPQEVESLAGRMWWSFYESDAGFENFVTRALAYVSRRQLSEVQRVPTPEREAQLLAALDHKPFLIVLDGLERILVAYSRTDASLIEDSTVSNQRNLRRTSDPRAGHFLKKLTQVKKTRILVSSRLYPADLEKDDGEPLPGSFRHYLTGLNDDDAVELWRTFGVSGARDMLVPIFDTFDKHPLLIQALAGEVKRYRAAPGNFEKWRAANPTFDPTKFQRLHDVMSHVLEFPLRGLNATARQTLEVIAGFRMPARYDTLAALLVGNRKKQCKNECVLDKVLSELEERGLVGWDRRANRYDLHPVVRGVVWHTLSTRTRKGIFSTLHNYFDAALRTEPLRVESVDDLAPAIELYNALLGLNKCYEAYELFDYRLQDVMSRLDAWKLQTELLRPLVECINDDVNWGGDANSVFGTLTSIGRAFSKTGQVHNALHFLCHARCLCISSPMLPGPYPWLLKDMSYLMLLAGHLYGAQNVLMGPSNHADGLAMSGIVFAACGNQKEFDTHIKEATGSLKAWQFEVDEGFIEWAFAQGNIWFKQYDAAYTSLNMSELIKKHDADPNFIWATRLKGEAAVGLNDFAIAEEQLHRALGWARGRNLREEELPALVALAELQLRQGNFNAAREFLDDVWEAAEQGPYILIHADACNALAQIERESGNIAAAVEAASRAYELAWCDGPPFAYHWGVITAQRHLRDLGAPEPQLPPFDEARFEPKE
jgi:tetratricopeptide (TPR) repeat protein